MSPHAETCHQALRALDWILGWGGGVIPIRVSNGFDVETLWHETGHPQRLAERIRHLDEELRLTEFALGLPRRSNKAGSASWSTVAWAHIEGSKQLKAALAFQPPPSVVIAEGSSSRCTLLWALTERLDYYKSRQANRRLAYRFGSVQRAGDPDLFWLPAPGTCRHVGRKRPCPVVVKRLTHDAYRPGRVVGRLKDPPEFSLADVLAAKAS